MPTLPRRWPIEADQERESLIQITNETIQSLQRAQEKLDGARQRIGSNEMLATICLADSERHIADALSRVERLRRVFSETRAKRIEGRWPMGVNRQREEVEAAVDRAALVLEQVFEQNDLVRKRMRQNPLLGETIIADTSLAVARTIIQFERGVRVLTEAGLGRE